MSEHILNWTLLGRTWKSTKSKLELALQELSDFKKPEVYFTETLMFKLFGDQNGRNWYRRIEDLEKLGVIHSPRLINDFGFTYSIRNHISRTFKIDKELLANSGYSLVKKPKISKCFTDFSPEVKQTCFCVKEFYRFNTPEKLASHLMAKRKSCAVKNQDASIAAKIASLPQELIGDIATFDYKVFFDCEDGVMRFNQARFDLYIEALKKNCIAIPVEIQKIVTEYNAAMLDDAFRVIFRPKITIKWMPTKVQISAYARALSAFCNSHKVDRQQWLDKIGLKNCNHFDITAAVPSVLRLLNKNRWDFSDPRIKIAKNCNIAKLPFHTLKNLIFKILFSESESAAWQHYNTIMNNRGYWMKLDAFKTKHPTVTQLTHKDGSLIDLTNLLSKKEFHKVCNEIQKVCGDSVGVKVFFYESIIEMLTLRGLQKQGFSAVNVYDCIYSSANETQIKTEMKKATKKLSALHC